MNEKIQEHKFSLIQEIFYVYMKNIEQEKRTFVRVFGSLNQVFQLNTLYYNQDDDFNKIQHLNKIKNKLNNFIDNELVFGLLEYKGYYLLVNLEILLKSNNFITGKRYFFLGEIISLNDILLMIPTTFLNCEDDLDLFLYEKTLDLMKNKIYNS